MKSRRNVLFISADQWRFECLSAMGHPLVQTPNLDAHADATRLNLEEGRGAPKRERGTCLTSS